MYRLRRTSASVQGARDVFQGGFPTHRVDFSLHVMTVDEKDPSGQKRSADKLQERIVLTCSLDDARVPGCRQDISCRNFFVRRTRKGPSCHSVASAVCTLRWVSGRKDAVTTTKTHQHRRPVDVGPVAPLAGARTLCRMLKIGRKRS